jgi:hypothetical protein
VTVAHGLLWVYPRPGEVGRAAAAAQPVPATAIRELMHGEGGAEGACTQVSSWFVRDMPMRCVHGLAVLSSLDAVDRNAAERPDCAFELHAGD